MHQPRKTKILRERFILKGENFVREILFPTMVGALRDIRSYYYAHKRFNHRRAQSYELKHGVLYMQQNNGFEKYYSCYEVARKQDIRSGSAWEAVRFTGVFVDKNDFVNFCGQISGKECMEIGSGPIGILTFMPWIKKRIILDPLVWEYRTKQLSLFGKTLFTDDILLYNQDAEILIAGLINKINGCLIIRNTLDHCENPWVILENIGKYSAKGCILLLWTDLWHRKGLDSGHRNITKNIDVFEKKIKDVGFKVLRILPDQRPNHETLNYGCVAVRQ